MRYDDILDRLDQVRQSGNGHTSRCPAHDDKSPSLSIHQADDGKVLMYCAAGCSISDVTDSIGIELKDLFPDSNLTKIQQKQYKHSKTQGQYEALLQHELLVLLQVVSNRVASRELARDAPFKKSRPEWKPMPDGHWEREKLAATRIQTALRALYDVR